MLSKNFKITLLFCFIFFIKNIAYSKTFDEKILYNYFSALVSLENNNITESLNYFHSSRELKESHPLYFKKYLFSLVLGGKVQKAISETKKIEDEKFL